ncbi:MAG: hemerythrin domain-containing protein [Bdellovibrionota bacterium]
MGYSSSRILSSDPPFRALPRPEKREEKLLREHEQLLLFLERLCVLARLKEGFFEESYLRGVVRSDLRAIHDFLGPHFAREEAGGYFADIAARNPNLTPKIEALHREHFTIGGEIEELIGKLNVLPPAEMRLRIPALAGRIREHEAKETALLQGAIEMDVGEGD